MGNMENQGSLPFIYSSVWDNNIEISEIFKEAWEPRVIGSPQYIWETKLKTARTKLKEWAKANEINRLLTFLVSSYKLVEIMIFFDNSL